MTQREITARQDREDEVYRKRTREALALITRGRYVAVGEPFWAREASARRYDPEYVAALRRQAERLGV